MLEVIRIDGIEELLDASYCRQLLEHDGAFEIAFIHHRASPIASELPANENFEDQTKPKSPGGEQDGKDDRAGAARAFDVNQELSVRLEFAAPSWNTWR